jgi:proteasome activator subunit 4
MLGKANKAGGKTEESMLSAIKTALDMVCQHVSEDIFDLVLRQTREYVVSNAKANAVRAFGQLVSCLARVNPKKTLATFFPLCCSRLEEELQHGASSIRTTSVNPASPSDTVFHWCQLFLFLINIKFSFNTRPYNSSRLFGTWRSAS